MSPTPPVPLDVVAEAFSTMEAPDRLEALVEFGHWIPELPAPYQTMRDAGIGIVAECEAPVFFVAESSTKRVRIYADAPREAAVARGFVGLLISTYANVPPDSLRDAPGDILDFLHLSAALSARRKRGLNGIYTRLLAALDALDGAPSPAQTMSPAGPE